MDEITVSGSDKNNETSEQQDWVCNFFAGKLKELTKELEVQKQLNALHQEELSTMTKMSLKTVNNLKKEKEKEVKELKGELKDEKDKNAKLEEDLKAEKDKNTKLEKDISLQALKKPIIKMKMTKNQIVQLKKQAPKDSTKLKPFKVSISNSEKYIANLFAELQTEKEMVTKKNIENNQLKEQIKSEKKTIEDFKITLTEREKLISQLQHQLTEGTGLDLDLNLNKTDICLGEIKQLEEVIAAKSTEVERLKEVNQTIVEQTQSLGKDVVKYIGDKVYKNNYITKHHKAQIHHLQDQYQKNVQTILMENLLLTEECSYLREENDRLKQ